MLTRNGWLLWISGNLTGAAVGWFAATAGWKATVAVLGLWLLIVLLWVGLTRRRPRPASRRTSNDAGRPADRSAGASPAPDHLD